MRLQNRILATAITASMSAPVALQAGEDWNEHGSMTDTKTRTSASESNGESMDRYGDHQTSPYGAPDDSWISISGTVGDVDRNEFELQYGDGSVTVEMADGDRDADAYKLLQGDKVRVMGRVDDDFLETTTIDAMSVQVDKLDTTFYADEATERRMNQGMTQPITTSETIVNGRVITVGADDFVIDTGMSNLTVDVDNLAADPLDDQGFLQIDTGDRVSVTGDMTPAFFERRQLDADVVVELSS